MRLLSLLIVLMGCAGALTAIGLEAFGNGNGAPDEAAGGIYAMFRALPSEAAYGAPLLAIALVAGAYLVLRMLGWLVTLAGGLVFAVFVLITVFGVDPFDILPKIQAFLAG